MQIVSNSIVNLTKSDSEATSNVVVDIGVDII